MMHPREIPSHWPMHDCEAYCGKIQHRYLSLVRVWVGKGGGYLMSCRFEGLNGPLGPLLPLGSRQWSPTTRPPKPLEVCSHTKPKKVLHDLSAPILSFPLFPFEFRLRNQPLLCVDGANPPLQPPPAQFLSDFRAF